MPFFEPLPPEPERPEHHWTPPRWIRPSEGTLPVNVPVNALVFQSEEAVVAVDHLGVYPNGFTINVVTLTDPRIEPDPAEICVPLTIGHPVSVCDLPMVG
jgi:hypothetical protein